MSRLQEAIERIKALECPTGQVGERIQEILEDYQALDEGRVVVNEDEDINMDGTKGYSIELSDGQEYIRVFSTAGLDDYVEKVVDAYME